MTQFQVGVILKYVSRIGIAHTVGVLGIIQWLIAGTVEHVRLVETFEIFFYE